MLDKDVEDVKLFLFIAAGDDVVAELIGTSYLEIEGVIVHQVGLTGVIAPQIDQRLGEVAVTIHIRIGLYLHLAKALAVAGDLSVIKSGYGHSHFRAEAV